MTFLPNRRVTSVSFPPTFRFDPDGTTFPVDDRNQMAAEGNQFSMVWADNRDLVGARNDPNVYFARQDACQLYSDEVDAIDEEIATLEDAIDSGAILTSQGPAIRRLIHAWACNASVTRPPWRMSRVSRDAPSR